MVRRAVEREYATEAARALLAAAFGTGRRRISATIRSANAPSLRVAEKLGFRRDHCTTDDDGEVVWMVREQRNFEVVVSAGSLRSVDGVTMPHRWTAQGVMVETDFTGAHLYHLSAAGCVLNDVYREADRLGIAIDGVRVRAYGDFDQSTWESTGIEYEIDVASGASTSDIERLVGLVDEVAEIPKALRAGATVVRRVDG